MSDILHIVTPEQAGMRIDTLSKRVLRVSQHQLASMKFGGGILLDGAPARSNAIVQAGQTLRLCPKTGTPSRQAPYELPLIIAYEDDDLLVIDKPAPLASIHSHSGGITLENAVIAHLGQGAVYRPVNRLDKGTSGLMVIAKNARCQTLLQRALHTDSFIREYLAVTIGAPMPSKGDIDLPIAKPPQGARRVVDPSGKPCKTHYAVLQAANGRALVRLRLGTGRTHQIRVHLAAVGCPVAGDYLYGQPLPALDGRFALHSCMLRFAHPLSGKTVLCDSPLPDALCALMPCSADIDEAPMNEMK